MTRKAPEFDRYATQYRAMHKESIRASGEDPEYFAAYKARYMARRFRKMGAQVTPAILDFGCGIGSSIPHLKRHFPGSSITGCDPSPGSIELATRCLSDIAEFALIEGDSLPFADGSFDVLLAACVFHHIKPEERGRWMSEIRRVLRPGGHAFIFEHNMLNPLTIRAVRECPFDEDAILLPRREVLSLARSSGFSRSRADYIVFFPRQLSVMRPLERAMGWVPIGAQYVVHAHSR